MTSILSKFPRRDRNWHPQTPEEFYALHVARSLDDVRNLGTYVRLANTYELPYLTDAFKKAVRSGDDASRLPERFVTELRKATGASNV